MHNFNSGMPNSQNSWHDSNIPAAKAQYLIRVFTLGRFSTQQINSESTAQFSARQQKPQELLQALIALGGRNISNDALCHTLWPDAEGDDASNSLDVNLHRLRKSMGGKDTILASGGRLTINNKLVWVDVWAFERLINQVDKLITSPDSLSNADTIDELFSASLDLYQGEFLIHERPQSWNLPLRERLRSKILRHISNVGELHEQHHSWKTAIRYYQRGIEIDALAEELYQRKMICLRELGRFAEALSVYQRCRTSLSSGLDVAPSELTEKIRNTLY